MVEVRLRHGHLVVTDARDVVRDAYRDLLPASEDVELRQHEVRHAVDARGVPTDDGVVPTATSRTAGCRAELVDRSSRKLFAVVVEEFGRERTFTDARLTYALAIAMTRSTRVGAIPEPVHAPPDVAFDDVTNGYVPWSTSSIVA